MDVCKRVRLPSNKTEAESALIAGVSRRMPCPLHSCCFTTRERKNDASDCQPFTTACARAIPSDSYVLPMLTERRITLHPRTESHLSPSRPSSLLLRTSIRPPPSAHQSLLPVLSRVRANKGDSCQAFKPHVLHAANSASASKQGLSLRAIVQQGKSFPQQRSPPSSVQPQLDNS